MRSGGCSGLSYVMDFVSPGEIMEDDVVDTYDELPSLRCVVDPKSMLYLYGMELDYSDELMGVAFSSSIRMLRRVVVVARVSVCSVV